MRRESIAPVRPALVTILIVTLLALPLQSCLKPTSVDCGPNFTCPAGEKCGAQPGMCIKTDCGDGTIQASELCDDGNNNDGDGCSANCLSDETCGNGIVDQAAEEKCDDGNTESGDGCREDCLSYEFCGNNLVDKGEVCDNGNNEALDGCSANCLSDETCGNGYVDIPKGEKCDDGNTKDGDGCSANCLSDETCGNGILDVSFDDPTRHEQCDDGNKVAIDNCNNECKPTICGDGAIDNQSSRHEQCDNGEESSECNFNCTKSECGDGILNVSADEECDDHNRSNDDNCLSTCKLKAPERTCGDGKKQSHEECDDGNTNACGTCNETCTSRQNEATATGKIIIIDADGSHIEEGEILSIHDGFKRLTFEFTTGISSHSSSHIPIRIELDDPNRTAKAIKRAITDSRSSKGFKISPQIDEFFSPNQISLTNDQSGAFGNKSIITSNQTGSIEITGMSGGKGYDCPEGMGCTHDEDCDRNLSLKCLIPEGKVRGTCREPLD
ncbi:DUF4215 domain-containing protein [Archangium violaceum]|uniref:DUF4215 domain-containing protein n=1 Tax=Archangium violaceum TaxID=83451 RepID=UPI002B2FB9D7|nr:DUF4215 domain-containing protein [Archangium gephyra]